MPSHEGRRRGERAVSAQLDESRFKQQISSQELLGLLTTAFKHLLSDLLLDVSFTAKQIFVFSNWQCCQRPVALVSDSD